MRLTTTSVPVEFFLISQKRLILLIHNLLLKKMEMYGIRALPLQSFTNYLTNRQQYVSLAGMESSKQTVVCGVPQGSSLGPLLFLIYINDIPNCSEKLSFRIFADDTNICLLYTSPSPRDLSTSRMPSSA